MLINFKIKINIIFIGYGVIVFYLIDNNLWRILKWFVGKELFVKDIDVVGLKI